MAKYKVTTPDGAQYTITAPDDATQEQIMAYAKPWYDQPTTPEEKNAALSLPGNKSTVNPLTVAAGTTLVGAGRSLDKVREGTKQALTAGNVIARELVGADTKAPLQKLAQQEQFQKEQDATYLPLQQQHPFLTGVGETLPTIATPMGQETAAARIFAPAIGFGTLEAAKYGSPAQRGIAGAKGFALGALGGSVGEIANSVISPAASSLTAPQLSALTTAASKIGVKPLPSQMTGNANLARIEDMLARVPGGAGVMQDFAQGNRQAVNQYASTAMGENTPAITKDVFAAAKARQGLERDALRQGAAMPVTADVFNAIDAARVMLSRGLKEVDGKSEALSLLSGLKNRLYNSKQLSGEDLQAITSDLKTAARGTDNQTIAAAYKKVQEAMDTASTIDKAALAKSNREIASRKTLQMPGVTNEVTGDVSPVVLGNRWGTQFGESAKTGKIDGPLADIVDYGKAMPPMRAGSPTFERGASANPMHWAMAPAYWAAAKAMTSGLGRDYLAKGLLGEAGNSARAGLLARHAALPLAMSPAEEALWQMGLLGYAQ